MIFRSLLLLFLVEKLIGSSWALVPSLPSSQPLTTKKVLQLSQSTHILSNDTITNMRQIETEIAHVDHHVSGNLLATASNQQRQEHDYDQVLNLAVNGAKTVFKAVGFIAKESVALIKSMDSTTVEELDITYSEALSKISKSGQGFLKLGLGLVQDTFALISTKDVYGKQNRNIEVQRSATIAIDEHSGVLHGHVVVKGRPTFSLSPKEASELWGYEIIEDHHHQDLEAKSCWENKPQMIFSLDQFEEMKSNTGKWMDGIVQSVASTTENVAKSVGMVLDHTVSAVDQIQDDIILFQGTVHQVSEAHKSGIAPYFLSTGTTNKIPISTGRSTRGTHVVRTNHRQKEQVLMSKMELTASTKPFFFAS